MYKLKLGKYVLPEDSVIEKAGKNIIIVRKSKSKIIKEGDLRCRDCEFFGIGHATKAIQYDSAVCFKKPKTEFKGITIYWSAIPTGKKCDKFRKKKL